MISGKWLQGIIKPSMESVLEFIYYTFMRDIHCHFIIVGKE